MKKIVFVTLLFSALMHGQSKFIEIEVRDSIRIQPLSFEYHIVVDDSRIVRYEEDGTRNDKEARVKLIEKYKELGEFLKTKGYQFRNLNRDNYEIMSYVGFAKMGYAVILKNANELDQLSQELKYLDYIRASLGEFELPDEDELEKRLFKKLLDKAQRKAETIAELSQMKLGRILEFREVPEIDNLSFNIMDIYVANKMRGEFDSQNGDLLAQRWKAIMVKYEAN